MIFDFDLDFDFDFGLIPRLSRNGRVPKSEADGEIPPPTSQENGMSVHRRFTYEWYTIKRKRGAKLSV